MSNTARPRPSLLVEEKINIGESHILDVLDYPSYVSFPRTVKTSGNPWG